MSRSGDDPILSTEEKEKISSISSHHSTDEASVTLTKKNRLSPYFTIAAAAFGLISDGYQNNLMTMANVVFKKLYPKDYTTSVSTRVSNSLLVGAILGQIVVGVICDRIGRKAALVITTALIVVGATLATAAHGADGSPAGLFWFLTFARCVSTELVPFQANCEAEDLQGL
jgi:MFS family permease